MTTLRRLAAATVAVMTLATGVAAQEMRSFTDNVGNELQIPVDPQRIVSLRDEFITAPLFELGANMIGSTGVIGGTIEDGAPYVRGAYDSLDFRFGEHDITYVGDSNAPDLEAIAKLEPDLIIVPDNRADNYDQLSMIAPTVVVQVWGQDMLDMYKTIADASGRLDRFELLKGHYEDRLKYARIAIEAVVGNPADVSIVVTKVDDGGIRTYRDLMAVSRVIRDIGFTTPALVAAQVEGQTDISPEFAPEINADFMIDTYWTAEGDTAVTKYAAWDKQLPGWREYLHFGKYGQHFLLNREEARSITFQALRSNLEIMVAQIATRPFVALKK
ncbi:iron complex transport system substrate-binding protein [Devosia sp. YR412]|uniref:ABC transporter substrate-binding protein n=1 Tax=Devosia sp. YR412 TaxID=1881030 RepID=UPI0008C5A7F0|nr:ABC transporter substrate-binding protein [Devosia sp. YR412]SEQ10437.1 iron complex transport system substrate-binding protein [Devosia sp. YR412]